MTFWMTPEALWQTALESARREIRKARFDGETVDCPVYQREGLDVDLEISGPAIIDQLDCTTVIFPGQRARVDDYHNLIIDMRSA